MIQHRATEGKVQFDVPNVDKPVSTWYKVIGDLSVQKPALVLLHGGPGAGHNYMLSHLDLHDHYGTPVVFYDQIGCGRSTRLPEKMGDEAFWTVDLFIKELDNLVDHLGLRKHGFYILGSSWGGMLAGAYASLQPAGLKKAVIASGPSDMSLYAKGARKLLAGLPEDVQKIIEDCERRGDYDNPEYEEASNVFASRHLCRLGPLPQPVQDSLANLKDDPTTYVTMQGPSEFSVIGSLRDWEGWSKAHLINIPILLTNGRYDEVQDITVKPWFDKIAKVKWVTFAESSHMPHWEERGRYMEIVGEFLEG